MVVVEDSPASMVAADPLKRKSRKMKTGKSQQEQGQKEEVMEEIKVINISFCLVAHEDTKCVLPVDKVIFCLHLCIGQVFDLIVQS